MLVGRALKRDQPLALRFQPVTLDGLVLGVVGQGDFDFGVALGALIDVHGRHSQDGGAAQQRGNGNEQANHAAILARVGAQGWAACQRFSRHG
ncbi:hypothetical protein D3C80_1794760 [compost metagenome]